MEEHYLAATGCTKVGYSNAMGVIQNCRQRSLLSGRSLGQQLCVDVVRSIPATAKAQDNRESKRSYSQFGEDCVIRSLLPERIGRYLDIGSGHPTRNSNTYLLYRRGWRGVLVEPIARLASLSVRKRKRDTVLNGVASSAAIEDVVFWEFEPSELSTTAEHRAQELVHAGFALRSTYPCKAFPISVLTGPVAPSEPFLFSIDTEGSDFQILSSLSWPSFQPRVVCLENHEPWSETSEVRKLMTSVGYKLISQHLVTSIYIHSEAEGLEFFQ